MIIMMMIINSFEEDEEVGGDKELGENAKKDFSSRISIDWPPAPPAQPDETAASIFYLMRCVSLYH